MVVVAVDVIVDVVTTPVRPFVKTVAFSFSLCCGGIRRLYFHRSGVTMLCDEGSCIYGIKLVVKLALKCNGLEEP